MPKQSFRQELIESIWTQYTQLPRKRKRGSRSMTLSVTLISNGHGMSAPKIGHLAISEVRRPSSKGGFKNGVLILRPTLVELDHAKCRLPRLTVPLNRIASIQVS